METFISRLDQWFTATAWRIPKPEAYGAFHLSFTLIGFLVCGLLAYRLRNISAKASRRLLIGIGIFLMITEVYKQLLYCLVIHESGYPWSIFPFQLCSIPMYLCVITPLLKPGETQHSLYTFMMLYNLLGGAISFAEPSGLLSSYVTLTAHSMIWHMLLVFVGLFLMFSGLGGRSAKDYRHSTYVFLLLCVVAFTINLVFRDESGGSINMFFIGPAKTSIAVFKQIAERFGWYVSTAIYIPAICLGAYLILRVIRHVPVKKAIAK